MEHIGMQSTWEEGKKATRKALIFRQKQSLCLDENRLCLHQSESSVLGEMEPLFVLSNHVLICQQFAFYTLNVYCGEGDNLIYYFRLWQVDAY